MQSGAISDTQISASSEHSYKHAATRGRLHLQKAGIMKGAWVVATADANQWLQVNLGRQYTKVTRVATQGRSDTPTWVTKYKLQYSYDGVNFQYYREHGQAKDRVI